MTAELFIFVLHRAHAQAEHKAQADLLCPHVPPGFSETSHPIAHLAQAVKSLSSFLVVVTTELLLHTKLRMSRPKKNQNKTTNKQTHTHTLTAKEDYLPWTLKMQRNFENKKYSDCIS